MYGLYYPAVLGAGIVFTLQRAATHSIADPAVAAALTALAFFSLSFASVSGFEGRYSLCPFLLDSVEVFAMFACFAFLDLIEPPTLFKPSLWRAYVVLLLVVGQQLLWRKAMGLTWYGYIDLKAILLILLGVGAWLGPDHGWLNWVITILFATTATLYVSNHPYDKKVRMFFFIKGGGSA
jgi:hypothetical protein